MVEIVKYKGIIWYGERPCRDADDAYCRFRDEYHRSLGKLAYYRLNRIGQRKERVHGYGFVFAHPLPSGGYGGGPCGTVGARLLGIVEGAYCRAIWRRDIPDIPDEAFDGWFDWVLSRGSGALRLVGRQTHSGRTNKRFKRNNHSNE